MKRCVISCLVFFTTAYSLFAQSTVQNSYLEAKRLFYTEDYISADAAFLELKDEVTFSPYAAFYRGLIQYKQGGYEQAVLLWKGLLSDNPNWERQIEVLYWLSVSSLQQSKFAEGLQFLDSYTNKSVNASLSDQLIPKYLTELPLAELIDYQSRYPNLRALAFLTAVKINKQPIGDQDRDLLAELIDRYQLPISDVMELQIQNEKKSYYDVAAVLPFVFSGLENPVATMRNGLVMDLFQGMQMAVEDLEEEEIQVRLHGFDTYKEADTILTFVEQLKEMDLIVGPLYPGPIDTIKAFSRKHQINMISPVTSNSSYLSDNPFAFMAKPSYETMARQLAKHVMKQPHKRTAFIYFSKDERDSLFAEAYKAAIEDSIFIWDFKSVDELTAKYLLDSLTDQYEYYYAKEEADSIAELEGRFVKTRALREDESENESLDSLAFYEVDENNKIINPEDPKKILAYEMKYTMPLDTVGHLLIVSRSMSLYNNFVSAKASRQDSMGIYGYSNWFDNQLVNYVLMDEVDATVASSDYYDKESRAYRIFSNKVMSRFFKPPSDFHVRGYDLMMYIGRMMKQHGRYFQFGAYESGKFDSDLMDGYDFPGINDNQAVPIIQIENYSIKKVN